MSDKKAQEEKKPIADETLDNVSGGYVLPRKPVTTPQPPIIEPGPGKIRPM